MMQSVRFTNTQQNLFFSTLRQRVDNYFRENKISKYANFQMVLKSGILITAYIAPFIIIITKQPPYLLSFLLWGIMGVAMAGIGMSVMHDANHGSYSSNSKINWLMGHTLNLLGGAVVNWKLQHNILHHTYTNIVHLDEDIEDKLIMRFSPHTPLKKIHQYQWMYVFVFYGILTIYWALFKDFVQFFQFIKSGVNKNSIKQNRLTFLNIILQKAIYFGLFFALPLTVFHYPFTPLLLGFLLMHFISGLILAVIFQLAHTVTGTSYPTPDENGTIENNWAVHQMNTTSNFARKSKAISWYLGGLNFQVEHHLFPNICHVHYPQVAEIVKSTAEEFNVPYLENITFLDALQSHIKALKKLGITPQTVTS